MNPVHTSRFSIYVTAPFTLLNSSPTCPPGRVSCWRERDKTSEDIRGARTGAETMVIAMTLHDASVVRLQRGSYICNGAKPLYAVCVCGVYASSFQPGMCSC